MFRFTTRDVLWLMVVVGIALAASVERYRSARLQSELWESAGKVWECEDRFVELALMWQARAPETVTIGDGRIEIKDGASWKLSGNEARLIKVYQHSRGRAKRQAMEYRQAFEAAEAKLKAATEPAKESNQDTTP